MHESKNVRQVTGLGRYGEKIKIETDGEFKRTTVTIDRDQLEAIIQQYTELDGEIIPIISGNTLTGITITEDKPISPGYWWMIDATAVAHFPTYDEARAELLDARKMSKVNIALSDKEPILVDPNEIVIMADEEYNAL